MASVAVVIALLVGVMVGCQKEDGVLWNDNIDISEFIDIPEMEADPVWFMDETLSAKYYKAKQRFNEQTYLESGYLKVKITRGEEIDISEQLFKIFNDGYMQINQDVKEGKYLLIKQKDGSIVSVRNKVQIPRLKSGDESAGDAGGWEPVNLNGSSQSTGMSLLDALKHYLDHPNSVSNLSDLVNLDSGNFSSGYNGMSMSGTFMLNGYTYTWRVANMCVYGSSQNCIGNNISGYDNNMYSNNTGNYMIRNNDSSPGSPLITINSNQAGSYSNLSQYLNP
jgi:hypothetical protein